MDGGDVRGTVSRKRQICVDGGDVRGTVSRKRRICVDGGDVRGTVSCTRRTCVDGGDVRGMQCVTVIWRAQAAACAAMLQVCLTASAAVYCRAVTPAPFCSPRRRCFRHGPALCNYFLGVFLCHFQVAYPCAAA